MAVAVLLLVCKDDPEITHDLAYKWDVGKVFYIKMKNI